MDSRQSLLRRWLVAIGEKRRKKRYRCKALFVHFWTGAESIEDVIDDISLSGFFMKTEARVYVGTVLNIVLQKRGAYGVEAWITVQARVVRHDPKGTGFEFVLLDRRWKETDMEFADSKALKRFLQNV